MKNFLKSILAISASLLFCFFIIIPFAKADQDINIYFFYGEGCPHCAKEEIFLDNLEKEKDNITIYRYEVWHNQDNAKLLGKIAGELKLKVSGVPLTIIGEKAIPGYGSDETTGQAILSLIDEYSKSGCNDPVAFVIGIKQDEECVHGCDASSAECMHDCGCHADNSQIATSTATEDMINLPIIGEVNVKKISLPFLTILIGILDGFNPCAMWVLLFLISMLLGMENRKRMWILGGAFILTSGAVYFLFLAAWLNFFLFIGYLSFVRMAIALVALWSGYYHLREYQKNKKGVCKVTEDEKRRKIFDRIKDVVKREKFWWAFAGIILLAGAVNLVELLCSAGLPAVYTQVLSLSGLTAWQYYGYLLLYIFFFMLDDMFIFAIAMVTLQMTGISKKYTRWSNLIGGIIMLIIGILLLFKPHWLMF